MGNDQSSGDNGRLQAKANEVITAVAAQQKKDNVQPSGTADPMKVMTGVLTAVFPLGGLIADAVITSQKKNDKIATITAEQYKDVDIDQKVWEGDWNVAEKKYVTHNGSKETYYSDSSTKSFDVNFADTKKAVGDSLHDRWFSYNKSSNLKNMVTDMYKLKTSSPDTYKKVEEEWSHGINTGTREQHYDALSVVAAFRYVDDHAKTTLTKEQIDYKAGQEAAKDSLFTSVGGNPLVGEFVNTTDETGETPNSLYSAITSDKKGSLVKYVVDFVSGIVGAFIDIILGALGTSRSEMKAGLLKYIEYAIIGAVALYVGYLLLKKKLLGPDIVIERNV